jgi:hypothetical protein
MAAKATAVEQVLARIAESAHGVVTRRQLLDAGVTRAEIEHRIRIGALLREHRGVFRVGHRAPSIEARYLAAVMACGDGAVLSGRAAGYLLGLLKGRPPPPEVTTPKKRRLVGVTVRESRLDRRERTTWRRIPVTTVPRTLVDLAAVLGPDDLARACHEADVRHRTTPAMVEAVLARRPNTPGAGMLRAVLNGDVRVLLSKLERGFVVILRQHRLDLPVTNRPAGAHYVDCRWPQHRLTVELDSYRYHRTRYAWRQDRLREREAYARGDELRRYTWDDVFGDPRQMLAELSALLR